MGTSSSSQDSSSSAGNNESSLSSKALFSGIAPPSESKKIKNINENIHSIFPKRVVFRFAGNSPSRPSRFLTVNAAGKVSTESVPMFTARAQWMLIPAKYQSTKNPEDNPYFIAHIESQKNLTSRDITVLTQNQTETELFRILPNNNDSDDTSKGTSKETSKGTSKETSSTGTDLVAASNGLNLGYLGGNVNIIYLHSNNSKNESWNVIAI